MEEISKKFQIPTGVHKVDKGENPSYNIVAKNLNKEED